jgi:hypothetical protein
MCLPNFFPYYAFSAKHIDYYSKIDRLFKAGAKGIIATDTIEKGVNSVSVAPVVAVNRQIREFERLLKLMPCFSKRCPLMKAIVFHARKS